MKAPVIALLFLFCYAECRKTYVPLDKNANTAFINFESGGVRPGNAPSKTSAPVQGKPDAAPKPVITPSQPVTPTPNNPPPKQNQPAQPPTQPKPAQPPTQPKPAQPTYSQLPSKSQTPNQIKPVPVNPAPVAHPATTPGPGSVKQLINYYDSQGKGSPIRPYSYSQAVKQG